jgi:hypothetical protein
MKTFYTGIASGALLSLKELWLGRNQIGGAGLT